MFWVKKNSFWLIPVILLLALLLLLLSGLYAGREDPRFESRRFQSYRARGLQPVSDSYLPRSQEKYGPDLRYTVRSDNGAIHQVRFHVLPLRKGFLLLGMEVQSSTPPLKGNGVYRSYAAEPPGSFPCARLSQPPGFRRLCYFSLPRRSVRLPWDRGAGRRRLTEAGGCHWGRFCLTREIADSDPRERVIRNRPYCHHSRAGDPPALCGFAACVCSSQPRLVASGG